MGKKAKQPVKAAGSTVKPEANGSGKLEGKEVERAVCEPSTVDTLVNFKLKEGKLGRELKELSVVHAKEGKDMPKSKDVKNLGAKEKDGKGGPGSRDATNGKSGGKKTKELKEKEEQAAIEGDCKQALLSLRRGNPQKAIKLIAEVNRKHRDHAMAHRICAHIQYRLAASIEEEKMKKSHLSAAMEAAKQAATLSPRSIEYRLFYATVMLDHAKTEHDYNEVKEECDRALQVEEPKDPAEDHLGEMDAEQAAMTPEARIEAARGELRNLANKAQMMHMQTWMHELTKGQPGPEKMRFIQLNRRGNIDEALEQRIAQPKRQDQVKKNVKTKEEMRAEIEVRVAAAKLVQQQKEKERENPEAAAAAAAAAVSANGDVPSEGGERRRRDEEDGGEGAGGKRDMKDRLKEKLKREERMKREGKGSAVNENVERVKGFWLSCDNEKRKSFYDINIEDLKKYLASTKASSENVGALEEALDFGKTRGHWIFWECCRCKERFVQRTAYEAHISTDHVGNLPQRLQRVLPGDVPDDWLESLLEEKVQPVDGPAAVRLLVELCAKETEQVLAAAPAPAPDAADSNGDAEGGGPQGANGGHKCDGCEGAGPGHKELSSPCSAAFDSASEGSDISGLSRVSSVEQFEDPVFAAIDPVDGYPSSPNGGGSGQGKLDRADVEEGERERANGQIVHHHQCTGDCQRGQGKVGRSNLDKDQLPVAEDPERRKLLEKIQGLFKTLYQNRSLALDHVSKVIEFALTEINNMVPDGEPHYEFNPTPLFVRFLKADHLKVILKYLMDLVQSLGIAGNQIQQGEVNETLIVLHMIEMLPSDRLLLNDDYSKLLIDDQVLYEEVLPQPVVVAPPERVEDSNGDGGKGQKEKEKELQLEEPQQQVMTTALDPDSLPLITNLRKVAKDDGRSFAEVQLQWVYTSADYEHRPSEFRKAIEDKMREAKENLVDMEKAFTEVRRLAERKRELMILEEGLNKAEALCQDELRRRQGEGGTPHDFDKVLKIRQAELTDEGARLANTLSLQRRLEYEAISIVLRESLNIQVPRFMEVESDDEDSTARHIREFITRSDSRIEMAIERQRQNWNNEITHLDAKMTQVLNDYRCAEISLNNRSIFDYRSILLPLTKSLLQHRLEEAAEKDAVKKSDAAREAFLAELASTATKEKPRALDGPKQGKGKDKKKDKKKSNKRPSAPSQGVGAQVEGDEEEAEEEVIDMVEVEDEELTAEEQRRRDEEEAVERQLKEALDRQLEAEAKMMERKKKEEAAALKRNAGRSNGVQDVNDEWATWNQGPQVSHELDTKSVPASHEVQTGVQPMSAVEYQVAEREHNEPIEKQKQMMRGPYEMEKVVTPPQRPNSQPAHPGQYGKAKPLQPNRSHPADGRPMAAGGRGGQRIQGADFKNLQGNGTPMRTVVTPALSPSRRPQNLVRVSPQNHHTQVIDAMEQSPQGHEREMLERDAHHQRHHKGPRGNWGGRRSPSHGPPAPMEVVTPEPVMYSRLPGWEAEQSLGANVWDVAEVEKAQGVIYSPASDENGGDMGWGGVPSRSGLVRAGVSPTHIQPRPKPADGDVDIDSLMRTLIPGAAAPEASLMPPPELRPVWSPVMAPASNGVAAPHNPVRMVSPMNGMVGATVLTPPAPRPPANSLTAAANLPGQQKISWAALAAKQKGDTAAQGGANLDCQQGGGSPLPITSSEEAENGERVGEQVAVNVDDQQYEADIQMAIKQSLDASAQGTRVLSQSNKRVEGGTGQGRGGPIRDSTTVTAADAKTAGDKAPLDDVGQGLQNEVGQYNCFLNVVIQSLWNLRLFRERLLASSSTKHRHVGEPCVVCALRNIFVALSTRPNGNGKDKDIVAPTDLRLALCALFAETDLFQESQMNDASEVLAVIFDCLHKAFSGSVHGHGNGTGGEFGKCTEKGVAAGEMWECVDSARNSCMAHGLFGLDVAEQMNCTHCGVESRHLKYTTFFHNINASALRTAKVSYEGRRLDELLKLVDMNHQLPCDADVGGCSQPNHIHHFLRAQPHVFTTVLGWQNGRESVEDISATVDSIEPVMDIGIIYHGIEHGTRHQLVSVVCYYGQHYHCFAYMHELDRWVMFDDSTVKMVGGWADVARTCRRGHLQPQVLFYEATVANTQ